MSEVKDELKSGAFVNFLGLLGKMAGPSFLILVNRFYGTDLFGFFITANMIIDIALAFLTSGFKDASVIYVSKYADHESKKPQLYNAIANSFVWSVCFAIVVLLLFLLFGDPLVSLFYEPEFATRLSTVLFLMILAIPFMAFDRVVISSTQGLKIMAYESLVNGGIRPVSLLGFTIGFWYIWPDLTGLGLGFLATQLFVFLISVAIFSYKFEWRRLFAAFRSLTMDKELLDFALPQNLNMTLTRFITGVDVLMLPIFGVSATNVGFYAVGSMIIREVRNVKLIFSSAFSPHIVRFYERGDLKELSYYLSVTANWVTTIAIPVILIILIHRQDLLTFIQPDFEGSTLFMLCLLPVTYLYNSFSLAGNIVTMTGHSKLNLMNTLSTSIMNVLLNMWLIPIWGLAGAAIASTCATLMLSILEVGESWKFVGVTFKPNLIYQPHLIGFLTLVGIIITDRFFLDLSSSLVNRGVVTLVSLAFFGIIILISKKIRDFPKLGDI